MLAQIGGHLGKGVISEGGVFEDEILERDYGHLDGKFVALRIDRLDVAFV